MSIEAAIHEHRAFYVNVAANCKADAVVGYALVYLELSGERASQGDMYILLFSDDGCDCGHLFYYSTKHAVIVLLGKKIKKGLHDDVMISPSK